MLQGLSFAHYLVIGGAAIGLMGLLLFWALPLKLNYPPFLVTALLALGYGTLEWWQSRSRSNP